MQGARTESQVMDELGAYSSNVELILLFRKGTTVRADSTAAPRAMQADIQAVLLYDQWTPSLSICFLAPCTNAPNGFHSSGTD